ncbi:MAG: SDR family NAD(P)-dependent oxidoreductase [candidate division Zixibacteria bacterium]|nr:SDR family NAD(P)-dependent oxidoreductase [candidate division Zixibacteria bacterium]
MNQSDSSILITGANGFVGAQLCRKFLDSGFQVMAGVRKTADLAMLEGLKVDYRFGDVTSAESLIEMVKDVDYVIHNAGVVKAKKKQMFYDVNEKGTANLFEAISRHNPNVKKVIYVSSLAAAGPTKDGRPVTESDKPNPISSYGSSKLAGEAAALSYQDKFNVLSIRPPAIYGPGDKEVFPFFEAVYKGIRPFIGDSSRKLQLVEVGDLCQAFYLAVTKSTPSGEICFVAESKAYSMKQLIELMAEACGKDGFRLYIPAFVLYTMAFVVQTISTVVGATPMLSLEKAKEILSSWEVTTSKAKELFGFSSSVSFEDGACATYDWYIKHGWLK